MTQDVTPMFRENLGDCEGRQDRCNTTGCPKFGTLGRPARSDGLRRVKGCGDPVAVGLRSKRKGQAGQAKAVTALGVPRSTIRPGHEEHLPGLLRIEVKAGAQAKPVWTKYLASEAQSEASRPFGDTRPFVASFEPDGTSDGLVVFRRSKLAEVVAALAEQLGIVA